MIPTSAILSALIFLGAAVAVQALPNLSARQLNEPTTALSTVVMDNYTPFTHYASAGYCAPSRTLAWDCGANCEANPGFKPVASGGDGKSVQYWYVGYDTNLHTVIVVHQGTNLPEVILNLVTDVTSFLTTLNSNFLPKIISDTQAFSTDADVILRNLDPTLFPGISSDIKVHSGFANEQAKTATSVLAAVQKTMQTYNTNSVSMVGHSLGAAISLLDSVYLPLWLPSTTIFKTIAYGLPRVGNQAFANYVDALNMDVTHINNKKDSIPTLPFKFLGFVHPSGEVHITESGEWEVCPGQDNPSTLCIVGDVPTILNGNLNDHNGPYNGIEIGC